MQMQAIPERYNRIYVPLIRCIGEQPFPLLHLPPAVLLIIADYIITSKIISSNSKFCLGLEGWILSNINFAHLPLWMGNYFLQVFYSYYVKLLDFNKKIKK
jgi:hypothetical protein